MSKHATRHNNRADAFEDLAIRTLTSGLTDSQRVEAEKLSARIDLCWATYLNDLRWSECLTGMSTFDSGFKANRSELGHAFWELRELLAKAGCEGRFWSWLDPKRIPRFSADELIADWQSSSTADRFDRSG